MHGCLPECHSLHSAAPPLACPTSLPSIPEKQARAASDRKSTRLNSSHTVISYAVFCLKKKKTETLASGTHHAAPQANGQTAPRDHSHHRKGILPTCTVRHCNETIRHVTTMALAHCHKQ